MSSQYRFSQSVGACAALVTLSAVGFALGESQEQKIPSPPPPVVPDFKPIDNSHVGVTKPDAIQSVTPSATRTTVSEPIFKGNDDGSAAAITPPSLHGLVFHSEDEHGTLWSMGNEFKASFSPAAATFFPRFPTAEEHSPIGFTLAGVMVGEDHVDFLQGVSAVRSADRIEYQRGALTEVYEIRPASMEQLFVFKSLPGSGDIVVRVDVESPMSASAHDGGLLFVNEYGTVGYSQAVAIDAAGQRLALATELIDGSIEIRVPAAFAAQARMPLTIDPVIGGVFTVNTPVAGRPNSNADVAFESGSGTYLFVWESAFNATDHDVFAQRRSAGAAVGAVITADFTSDSWTKPKVASNSISNLFLVVAEEDVLPAGGLRQISSITISTAGVAGTQGVVSTDPTHDCINPDVGGDPVLSGPTYFMVVWERVFGANDHDIHAQLVTSGGANTGGLILVQNATTDQRNPSISKSDGNAPFATQRWTIVYQQEFSAGDNDIYGAQYLWDGSLVNAPYIIDFSGLNDAFPSASSPLNGASGERSYMVAYQRGNGAPRDVQLQVFNGTTAVAADQLYLVLSNTEFGADQLRPQCDSDGHQFGLVWGEQFGTSTDYDTHICQLYVSGANIGQSEGRNTLGFSTSVESLAQICSDMSGGGTTACYMATWQDETVTAANAIIEGARYCGNVGGPITAYCFGTAALCPCGNSGAAGNGCANSQFAVGANLAATGVSRVSADTMALTGTNMPNSSALYFQGNSQSSSVFGDGLRCATGGVVRLATKNNVGNTSSYPGGGDPSISVRGFVPAAGARRYYQVWYRNAAAFCTVSTFNLSNGVSIVWIP